MSTPFDKVLIANRGEIAVRIIRALREQSMVAVAVYSEADRDAPHVRFADEAYCIGPAPSAESYLKQETLFETAARCGAQAIHPGYGFLSENASFARESAKRGFVFIGPSPDTIAAMGDKLQARETARRAGVPVIPGSPGPVRDEDEAVAMAKEIGYPVMLKASAGGGGKGMRVAETEQDLRRAFDSTRSEAENAFGDGTLYLEKFIEKPRHIEVQIMGDNMGHIVHLGERECSLQRRHQKVVEEAPSMVIDDRQRAAMGEAAIKLARAVDYTNAGTVEFIYGADKQFYFLEMNTRLQVEHPVTELVYGVDIVREQIRIAQGEPLSWRQEDLVPKGWAIECRIYAEDPYNNFLPSLGRINRLRLAAGPGVRSDVAIAQGYDVPRFYDPMLGKLIVHGSDREHARLRMLRALQEALVEGVRTNIPFHRWVLAREEFIRGDFDTKFIETVFHGVERQVDPARQQASVIAAVIATHEKEQRIRRPEGSGGCMNPWRLLGRPGAETRDA
jgi:acetyl-CoA carboxylase biotin carboxylase subunit